MSILDGSMWLHMTPYDSVWLYMFCHWVIINYYKIWHVYTTLKAYLCNTLSLSLDPPLSFCNGFIGSAAQPIGLRRTTNEKGESIWEPSPLLRAMESLSQTVFGTCAESNGPMIFSAVNTYAKISRIQDIKLIHTHTHNHIYIYIYIYIYMIYIYACHCMPM